MSKRNNRTRDNNNTDETTSDSIVRSTKRPKMDMGENGHRQGQKCECTCEITPSMLVYRRLFIDANDKVRCSLCTCITKDPRGAVQTAS